MKGFKILKGLMICLALMFIIGAISTAASAATVITDKPDYAPGEVVIITGSGWMPGETVSMLLHEESQLGEPDVTLLSEADADGNIINAVWSPDVYDIGLTFTLTATGQTSGLTAQTAFTDGSKVGSVVVSAQEPSQLCAGGSATYDVTVNRGSGSGSSGDFNAALSITTLLPTGATALFSACSDPGCAPLCTTNSQKMCFDSVNNSIRFDNGDSSLTVTLAISTTTSTSSASFTVRALNSTNDYATYNAALSVIGEGGSCDDGDLCTTGDVCTSGSCAGTPVVCTESDQCHVAGTCDPANGQCSNPNAPDGTSCNDGNACTQTDSCQAGVCTGGNPVVCTAQDQCHIAGTCDPANGQCSNPIATNGTSCSDGNACTQTDSCQAGVCTGGNPVVCTAQDQCHVAGTCDPANGQCSNPIATNGTSCSDGNACTQTDSCQAGVCTGGNPVVCTAQDQCHVAGTCDPANGQCSNPPAPIGTACTNEGNPCASQCDGAGICLVASCSAVTSSSLCPFDVDNSNNNPVEDQFRLILTPDQSASVYKLNASNPGQFYYNVFDGSGTGKTLVIDIPYPFVTQGANPIHVYDGALNANGCLLPGNEVTGCTINTIKGDLLPSGAPVILLGDYGAMDVSHFDVATTAQVTCPVPLSGVLYVNIHLDYGLKGTTGYSKNSTSDVTYPCTTLPCQVVIPNMESYTFSFGDALIPVIDSYTVQSENVFKKDPGIGGLVLDNSGTPVSGVMVKILDSKNTVLATVYTDQDGWYMWQYKWTGKAATFTVKLPAYNWAQSVTLKSNGFVTVNFTLP